MSKHRYGDDPEIDAEFDLALAETVRRKWMSLMGVPEKEIDAYVKSDPPINFEEELRQLDAVKAHQKHYSAMPQDLFDSMYRCRAVQGSDGNVEWI